MNAKTCPHCNTTGSIYKGACRFCRREVSPPVKHVLWDDDKTVCGKKALTVFVVRGFTDATCKKCDTGAYLKRVEQEDAWDEQRDANEMFLRLVDRKES